jgi:hypothetical protein
VAEIRKNIKKLKAQLKRLGHWDPKTGPPVSPHRGMIWPPLINACRQLKCQLLL